MAIFINGTFRESDPAKKNFNMVLFHGVVGQKTQNSQNEKCDGEMVDEQRVISLINHWKWNQEEGTLKFLVAPKDEPHRPTFYNLRETSPLVFEGTWETPEAREKARLILTVAHHQFFTY